MCFLFRRRLEVNNDMKSKKRRKPLMNQGMNFNNFRKNILIIGKALIPKTYYPVNADKKAVIKNIK